MFIAAAAPHNVIHLRSKLVQSFRKRVHHGITHLALVTLQHSGQTFCPQAPPKIHIAVSARCGDHWHAKNRERNAVKAVVVPECGAVL